MVIIRVSVTVVTAIGVSVISTVISSVMCGGIGFGFGISGSFAEVMSVITTITVRMSVISVTSVTVISTISVGVTVITAIVMGSGISLGFGFCIGICGRDGEKSNGKDSLKKNYEVKFGDNSLRYAALCEPSAERNLALLG